MRGQLLNLISSPVARNAFANYASTAYTALIGVVVAPLFHGHLGAEGYALIGIYAVLQTWFVLLDGGLSAGLSRVCTRLRAGKVSIKEARRIFRLTERIVAATSGAAAALLFFFSDFIAHSWLNFDPSGAETAAVSLEIMALVLGLRCVAAVFRGVLSGAERHVWLSSASIFFATLRFPVSLLLILQLDLGVIAYFTLQVGISVLEFVVLRVRAWRELSAVSENSQNPCPDHNENHISFSASLFAIGLCNTTMMQFDKLVLSGSMSGADYGDFILVMAIPATVFLVAGPMSTTILPILVRANAGFSSCSNLYLAFRRYWIIAFALLAATSAAMATTSWSIIYAWSGDARLANAYDEILAMYALGNCMFAMSFFSHYLQYARGDVSMQLRHAVLMALVYVPIVIFVAKEYGAIGTAILWLLFSIFSMVVLISLQLGRMIQPMVLPWMIRYVAFPTASMAVFIILWGRLFESPQTLFGLIVTFAICFFGVLACFVVSIRSLRQGVNRAARIYIGRI